MTSRYRVEYALKSHRRDEFIEWIKGLLAVPFVLRADAENYDDKGFKEYFEDRISYDEYVKSQDDSIDLECQKGFLSVFRDVERLIDHTILIDKLNEKSKGKTESRLRKLVPSIGIFHTQLPLCEAFLIEDGRRMMSKRRLVLPSFNDVRTILNTAQILALLNIYRTSHGSRLKLITFDGDVTLYNDGASLTVDSPIVYKLVELLKLDLFVGVVTAAGYPGQSGADQYYERLRGLIDVLRSSTELTDSQKANLLVMGGESNYLFRYDNSIGTFRFIEGDEWYLPMMKNWDKSSIETIMESSYQHIRYLQKQFNLAGKTSIIRKKRSIGIVPNSGEKILREQLEEMVLSCSINVNSVLEKLGQKNDGTDIRVCAFNGGSDVWVDIGDKSLGVESLQRYLCKEVDHEYCPILKSESLHIGDQFASLGANDFKARLSACTVWIANPKETDAILEDLISQVSTKK